MKSTEFSDWLESELSPLTDAQADAVSAGAESNWRYRVEIWCLLAVSAVAPVAIALLGFSVIGAYDLTGQKRLIFGAVLIACIYGSVVLLKALAKPLVTWRFRASLVRQFQQLKHASGL